MDSSTDNNRTSNGGAGHPSSEQPAETPRLCSRGCGFFGTAENSGLCSKCFADELKEKMAKLVIKNSTSTEERIDKVVDSTVGDDNNNNKPSVSATPIASNRCGSCRKKVGLLGFVCRCGGNFCGMHRYPEAHSCRFDFKKAGRIAIQKENPLCTADKIRYRL